MQDSRVQDSRVQDSRGKATSIILNAKAISRSRMDTWVAKNGTPLGRFSVVMREKMSSLVSLEAE